MWSIRKIFIDKIFIEKTEEFGRKLALCGHGIVYGGGAQGLMGAVARGVYEKGGNIMKNVTVAMSGGVDSAAACAMLIEQGYNVRGATMRLGVETDGDIEIYYTMRGRWM